MSDYQRVTLKQGKPKIVSKRVYERLQELEDKIENGTLIELLCKNGDKIYQFDNGGKIYESEVKSIYYDNKNLIYDCGYFAFDKRALGESIFLTKAEAEKKLEELKNKEKGNE